MIDDFAEKILLNKLTESSEDAYEMLFHHYYKALIAYCKQFVEKSDAEEIVQELWLYIWQNREDLNIQSTFKGYLFIACRNRCLTLIRNQSSKASSFYQLSQLAEFSQDAPDFYFEKELEEIVKKSIDRLPEKFKEAFILNRYEDLTYKEIAEKLGVSSKTVDYRIQMALKLLRKDLKKYLKIVLMFYPNLM